MKLKKKGKKFKRKKQQQRCDFEILLTKSTPDWDGHW